MQVISADNPLAVDIRSKDTTVRFGPEVQIGSFTLPGPGEYEISGVMAQASPTNVRLRVEDLEISYVLPTISKVANHDLEALGTVALLILPVSSGGLAPKEAVALLKDIEAPLALLLGQENDLAEVAKHGLKPETIAGAWKLTRAQVPTEGSQVVTLTK